MVDRRFFIRGLGAAAVAMPAALAFGEEAPRGLTAKLDPKQMDLRSQENLAKYGNCAQAAFATLQEHLDLDGGRVLKALGPFPGGVALRGETCGAVVGSLMALGLVFGRDSEKADKASVMATIGVAREFCGRFAETYGSTLCAEIVEAQLHLGRRLNFADPADQRLLQSSDKISCVRVVATAVKAAAEVARSHKA